MSASAPVCSPTLTISRARLSSIRVDSSAVVRLRPSRIWGVAEPTAAAMARLPTEAEATSMAFTRGRPPDSSADSVRASWLVAYIRISDPR